MNNKVIFIHVPKTGGTTINAAMNETYWQTKPDFNYRHIDSVSMISNSADIFKPSNFEKYQSFKIFMMLRNPVDRLISEYSFIKERRQFMGLLNPKPKNFEDYVKSHQTFNGMLKFLLGHRMYSKIKINSNDLDDVLNAVEEIPIYVGIFEDFGKSLMYFSEKTGVSWKNKIEVKRMTFNRPKVEEIPSNLIKLIHESNQLDVELYNETKVIFEEETKNITSKIKFLADKYNHAIPYAYNFCFFEYCLENKAFININLNYFKSLTDYLIKVKKITDGKTFTLAYLQSFVNQVAMQYPKDELTILLQKEFNPANDPLTELEKIAQTIDNYFNNSKINPNKRLSFEEKNVIVPSQGINWLKKLFN